MTQQQRVDTNLRQNFAVKSGDRLMWGEDSHRPNRAGLGVDCMYLYANKDFTSAVSVLCETLFYKIQTKVKMKV